MAVWTATFGRSGELHSRSPKHSRRPSNTEQFGRWQHDAAEYVLGRWQQASAGHCGSWLLSSFQRLQACEKCFVVDLFFQRFGAIHHAICLFQLVIIHIILEVPFRDWAELFGKQRLTGFDSSIFLRVFTRTGSSCSSLCLFKRLGDGVGGELFVNGIAEGVQSQFSP